MVAKYGNFSRLEVIAAFVIVLFGGRGGGNRGGLDR